MIKKFKIFFICVCVLLSVAGCASKANTSVSYTYSVETGDKIKITLDTSDKYELTSKLPFSILHDGKTLSQGKFITAKNYSEYADVVNSNKKAKLIDSGSKNGDKYIFWSYNDSEYNYAVLIAGSNTAVLIGNPVSEESAKECFKRVDISKAK